MSTIKLIITFEGNFPEGTNPSNLLDTHRLSPNSYDPDIYETEWGLTNKESLYDEETWKKTSMEIVVDG